jgi:ubiquitin thioesterase OTU1
VKSGYPPKALTLVPELPLSSLGLQPGDQIIVSANVAAVQSPPELRPPPPAVVPDAPTRASQPAASRGGASSDGPVYVETQDGFMVHRVRPARIPTTLNPHKV